MAASDGENDEDDDAADGENDEDDDAVDAMDADEKDENTDAEVKAEGTEDGDGSKEEVIGEGVVGETPELAPGASYSYTSGALIPTPVGSMKGSYGFVTVGGESFRAEIPEFALHAPDSLH